MSEETTAENQKNMQAEIKEVEYELELIEIVALLWKKIWWIALGTALFTCIGLIYALTAENKYTAQAIFAPREAEKNAGAGLLAQMGGLGGMIASQMGIGGTSLEHIVIIARSHDLAEVIINKYDLLPKLFYKKYDFENKKWTYKDTTEIPSVKKGIKVLSENIVTVSSNARTNIIMVKAEIHDSVLAQEVVNYYLHELESKLKNDIVEQSREKKAYLDKQMRSTEDPWMIQKLQTLAGAEVEKSMLVAGSALNVLETPMVPINKSKPKRKIILVISFLGGIFFSLLLVLICFYSKWTRLPEIIKNIGK
jgi:uncharacterized protein involved in exopolysaccharide biosynthesis